jgi:integrase
MRQSGPISGAQRSSGGATDPGDVRQLAEDRNTGKVRVALGLRWSDVDLHEGLARIVQTVGTIRGHVVRNATTKDGDPRAIHLDDETIAVLRRHKSARTAERLAYDGEWQDNNLVFCRGINRLDLGGTPGAPANGDRVSASFNAAIRGISAKFPKRELDPLPVIRLHDARHTWATLALRAGVPVKVVQERLGHAHPSITMGIYAHVQPGMDKDAAMTVAALF